MCNVLYSNYIAFITLHSLHCIHYVAFITLHCITLQCPRELIAATSARIVQIESMDQIRISDLDSTMAAKRTFDDLLAQIQASNLNFHLQLSPFSASISLKKSLIKYKFGNTLLPPCPLPSDEPNQPVEHEDSLLLAEKDHLKQELVDLQKLQNSSTETIQIFEQKIANMEASALKSFEERNVEVTSLKKSIKTSNLEIESLKKDLQARNKHVKEKENETNKLEQKCENLVANLKRTKNEMNSMKSENLKLIRKQEKVKIRRSKNVSTNTIALEFPSSATTLSTKLTLNTTTSVKTPSVTCSTVMRPDSLSSPKDLLNNVMPRSENSDSSSTSGISSLASSSDMSPRTPPGTPPSNTPSNPEANVDDMLTEPFNTLKEELKKLILAQK